jgi:cyclopropane fatty-acyl-phospholipid synthase-like methyltransferase
MFGHVGEEHLAEYFSRVWQLLRSGGRFLNSGVAATATDHRQGPSFIDHYVFPDGELVPLDTCLGEAERSGFEVRDVESLREHYALTLHHWVRRLEAHADESTTHHRRNNISHLEAVHSSLRTPISFEPVTPLSNATGEAPARTGRYAYNSC